MFKQGDSVWNTQTGTCGTVRGVWVNNWSGRTIVNVLPDGANKANWQMWDSEVVSFEPITPVYVAVSVLDEVIITGDGTDGMYATVLDIQGDIVFIHLTDYGEYVGAHVSRIVRNLTKTEKVA